VVQTIFLKRKIRVKKSALKQFKSRITKVEHIIKAKVKKFTNNQQQRTNTEIEAKRKI